MSGCPLHLANSSKSKGMKLSYLCYFSFDENEKKRFEEYLAHSGRVADRHYRLVVNDHVAKTGEIIDSLFSV